MSVSIVACPSCQSLLLSDTIQCPTCQYVIDPSRKTEYANGASTPSQLHSTIVEDPCPACGESVRRGLVRCWQCGTFMREEIAESYRKMKGGPNPIIYSPNSRSPSAGTGDGAEVIATDDDFVLASAAAPPQQEAATPAEPPEAETEVEAEDEFELQPSVATRSYTAKVTSVDYTDRQGADTGQTASTADETSTEATDAEAASSAGAGEKPAEDSGQSPEAGEDTQQFEDAGVDHSVATGGDALLQVALDEEAETAKRLASGGGHRGATSSRTGFLVYCANGHRVEVQERHRGKTGKCPRCKSLFVVPEEGWDEKEAARKLAEAAAAKEGGQEIDEAAETAKRWIIDVHIHTIDPAKLKIVPGSLQKTFDTRDFGFLPDGILSASLVKKGGLFGSADKERESAREAMLAHLKEEKPLDELPVAERQLYEAEQIEQMAVVQPAAYAYESMFAGVPVFGDGRIAIRLPKTDEGTNQQMASFTLSEFRKLSGNMAELYNIHNFGAEAGVPLTDEFVELTCHYSEVTLHVIEDPQFHQADPGIELKLAGRKCQGCGLVISEDSRKKEKIGGSSGKVIAKAKCPKCKEKFGDISLFAIVTTAETADTSEAGVPADSAAPTDSSAPAAESPQETDTAEAGD